MGPRYQDKKRTILAQLLSRQSTDAEKLFWYRVRNRRFMNLKFRRQVPFGPYILDFYCAERSIAVEIDGRQHHTQSSREYDAVRDRFIFSNGVRVLRYTNDDISM